MNGATALDCENTISSPNSTNTITIGTSQYFFSCLRNWKNSPRTRPLLICEPLRCDAALAEGKRERPDGGGNCNGHQVCGEAARVRGAANNEAASNRTGAESGQSKRQPTHDRHTDQSAYSTQDPGGDADHTDVEPRRILHGRDHRDAFERPRPRRPREHG